MSPPMSQPAWPPDEGLRLYRQLCDEVPTASSDFADHFLPPLLAWLEQWNRRVAPDLREEAAHLALVSLIQDPSSYDPRRGDLATFLRMSAQGDLRNLLAREQKHRRGRIDLWVVEHSPEAGKYLGKDDDPS